jgi:hypothetical protein
MVRKILYIVAVGALLSGCISVHTTEFSAEKEPCRVLRHVVLFKFKDGTKPEDVRRIETAFAALPGKIDAIHDFEWGTDVSVEDRAQGFTHCFVVTFASEADRAKYLPHPAHAEFGSIVGPHLEKVLVVDYWRGN